MGCCCWMPIPFQEPTGRFNNIASTLHRFHDAPLCQIFYPSRAAPPNPTQDRPYWRREVANSLSTGDQLNCCLKNGVSCCLVPRLERTRHPCGLGTEILPNESGYPVILFSHGLLGTLEMYTTLCLQLASFGYIVVAPEHEDGSALYAHPENSPALGYTSLAPLPEGLSLTEARAHVQETWGPRLDTRHDEIKAILAAIKCPANTSVQLVQEILQQMDLTQIHMAGHSFGAATAVKASVETPGISFTSRVILDLWAAPVPSGCFVESPIPSIFVASETFLELPETKILTKELADKSLVGANRSTSVHPEVAAVFAEAPLQPCELLYLRKSAHQQFSDTPQFLPVCCGRRVGLTGDCDWELQHRVLVQLITDFMARADKHPRGHDRQFGVPIPAEDSKESAFSLPL